MSFRGTPISEESLNKRKEKDLKDLKFDKSFKKKVDLNQINRPIIIKWISKRLDELIPDDDIIISFLLNLIFGDNFEQFMDDNEDNDTDNDINNKNKIYEITNNFPDIKEIHSQMISFLGDETLIFTKELWELMLSAQDDKDGIPPKLIHMMEEELKKKEELKNLREIERKEKESKMREYRNNRGRVGKERFNDRPNYNNNRANSNNKHNSSDYRQNKNNYNTENLKYQGKQKRSDLTPYVSNSFKETRSERKPYDSKKLGYNSTKSENENITKNESTVSNHELLLRKIDLEKKAILEKIKEKELKKAEDDVDRYRDRRHNATIMKEISEIKNDVEPANSNEKKNRDSEEKDTHHHHRHHHHHHHHYSSSRSSESRRTGTSDRYSRSHRREEDREHRSHTNSHSNHEHRHSRSSHHRREHHREGDSKRSREKSPSRSSKSKEAETLPPPPPPPLSPPPPPPPHIQDS